jgi:hypothetical protein
MSGSKRGLQIFRLMEMGELVPTEVVLDILAEVGRQHMFNMELDLQSLFGLHVHSCTHRLRPRIWVHIRGR